MKRVLNSLLQIALTVVCLAWGGASEAQVLIWNLPKEDGTWIRFEGTYKQTQSRPNSAAGDQILEWQQELLISSVGKQTAEYQGKEQPCRWVEFRSTTKPAGVDQAPGPGGVYIYKVLIPEASVIGKPADEEQVPVTFLPVIEGLRRVGDRPVEKVTEKALAVYPHISQLTYYPDLAPGDPDTLLIAGENVTAQINKGTRLLEDKRSRSLNAATLWLAPKLPFGLAKFGVKIERDTKLPSAPASEFKRTAVIEVEMAAVETGAGARSELAEETEQ
jgi:hypothetical protein